MTVDWVCKHHTDLGKEQLYAILRLRSEVFVVEQKCVYQDIDGQDLEGLDRRRAGGLPAPAGSRVPGR
jgi:ElaA protein